MRVLVVDDDDVYGDVLFRVLTREGFETVLVRTVADARVEIERRRPDAALIDLKLPDGSGVELVATLGRLAPGCRAIILTGHGTIPSAVGGMRAGAVDFLTKPLAAADVVSALRDAMRMCAAPVRPVKLDDLEREHILAVLDECGGNVSEAARRLGLYRRTLQRKLQKLPQR